MKPVQPVRNPVDPSSRIFKDVLTPSFQGSENIPQLQATTEETGGSPKFEVQLVEADRFLEEDADFQQSERTENERLQKINQQKKNLESILRKQELGGAVSPSLPKEEDRGIQHPSQSLGTRDPQNNLETQTQESGKFANPFQNRVPPQPKRTTQPLYQKSVLEYSSADQSPGRERQTPASKHPSADPSKLGALPEEKATQNQKPSIVPRAVSSNPFLGEPKKQAQI